MNVLSCPCGRHYFAYASTAVDRLVYCSTECEGDWLLRGEAEKSKLWVIDPPAPEPAPQRSAEGEDTDEEEIPENNCPECGVNYSQHDEDGNCPEDN